MQHQPLPPTPPTHIPTQDPSARPDFAEVSAALFRMFSTNKSAKRAARAAASGSPPSGQQQQSPPVS